MPDILRKKQTPLQVAYDYLMITFGIGLFVLAWSLFIIPNNMIGGGVSGMSAVIYYATGISIGLSNIVINGVLLILAFIILGRAFGVRTIYAILLSSVGFYFLPDLMPKEFVTTFALNNGKMLCTIIGGMMTGLGIGISFTHGGSTGGTDIVAMIINKYRNISPGRLLLMLDAVIILSSLFFPSIQPDGTELDFTSKVAVVIYALILVGVNSITVDMYLTGAKQSVQVLIFSKQYEKIADGIAYELDRGVTLLRSRGWYHKQESEVIMVVARKTDLNVILRFVQSIDPSAFISVTSAMGVFGLGFDTIKRRSSRDEAKK